MYLRCWWSQLDDRCVLSVDASLSSESHVDKMLPCRNWSAVGVGNLVVQDQTIVVAMIAVPQHSEAKRTD